MPSTSKTTQRHRYIRAARALLTNTTRQEAAREAGISLSTLERWTAIREFQDILEEAQQQSLNEVLIKSRQVLTHGLDALMRNMNCGVPIQEVRAAEAACNIHMRLIELLNFGERLSSLEIKIGDIHERSR